MTYGGPKLIEGNSYEIQQSSFLLERIYNNY